METDHLIERRGQAIGSHRRGWVQTAVLAFLNFYRGAISPTLPSSCKFYPNCSAYAVEAVERYGPARGLRMAALRILRCRPLRRGGYDPVP